MRIRGLSRFLSPAVLLAAVPLASAAPPSSAFMDECARCYNSTREVDAHVFGYAGYFYPYEYMDCDEFNSCHEDSQGGFCHQFHNPCPTGALLLDEAKKTLASGNADSIRKLVQASGSKLKYDARSGMITVLDCDQSVLETLLVPSGLRASIAG